MACDTEESPSLHCGARLDWDWTGLADGAAVMFRLGPPLGQRQRRGDCSSLSQNTEESIVIADSELLLFSLKNFELAR
jgi:hypothetical protein